MVDPYIILENDNLNKKMNNLNCHGFFNFTKKKIYFYQNPKNM